MPSVQIPGMTPQEIEILNKRLGYLGTGLGSLQQRLQEIPTQQPALYQLAGLTPDLKPIDTTGEQQRKDIQNALHERTLAYLSGNMPISPALERDIQDMLRRTGEATQRQYGTLWPGTTGGIETMGRAEESGLIAREEERRRGLSEAVGLGLQREAGTENLAANRLAQAMGIGDLVVKPSAGLISGSTGYQGPEELLRVERLYPVAAQLDAAKAQALADAATAQGLMTAAGQVAPYLLNALFGTGKSGSEGILSGAGTGLGSLIAGIGSGVASAGSGLWDWVSSLWGDSGDGGLWV